MTNIRKVSSNPLLSNGKLDVIGNVLSLPRNTGRHDASPLSSSDNKPVSPTRVHFVEPDGSTPIVITPRSGSLAANSLPIPGRIQRRDVRRSLMPVPTITGKVEPAEATLQTRRSVITPRTVSIGARRGKQNNIDYSASLPRNMVHKDTLEVPNDAQEEFNSLSLSRGLKKVSDGDIQVPTFDADNGETSSQRESFAEAKPTYEEFINDLKMRLGIDAPEPPPRADSLSP
jgi:hypothetical protein